MSEENKLAAAIDRLTAAIRKSNELSESTAKILKLQVEETRRLGDAAEAADPACAIANLLSGLGSLATSASLNLLTDGVTDEPSPSRRKKRRRAA